MSDWQPFNQGQSIGMKSSEGGVIVRDERHPLGARIILKQGKGYISISCNISGRIDHTRFFTKMSDAQREYDLMKVELAKIVRVISSTRNTNIKGWEAISAFVAKFQ